MATPVHLHERAVAALLTPWCARPTVADLTIALTGISVTWDRWVRASHLVPSRLSGDERRIFAGARRAR